MRVNKLFPKASLDVIAYRGAMNHHIFDESTLEEIFYEACEIFNLKPDIVRSAYRKREYCFCRQIICYVVRKKTSISLSDVGAFLGGRDHTTVIHSCDKVKDCLEVQDPIFMSFWRKYLSQTKIFSTN